MPAHRDVERAPVWIFDLDGTLYPKSTGYEDACFERIFEFMVRELGYESTSNARSVWHELHAAHHQTLKGLRAAGHTDFSSESFWEFFRGDPAEYVRPNAKVSKFVQSLCGRKYGKAFSFLLRVQTYEPHD